MKGGSIINLLDGSVKSKLNLVMSSGGICSAVLLACLKNMGAQSKAIFFYHRGMSKELQSTKRIASYYGVDLVIVKLEEIYGSMSIGFPPKFEKMDDFYIPYRNGVFTSVASAYAYHYNCENVLWGLAASSAAYYSDCSVHFFESQSMAVHYGTNSNVRLMAPFLEFSKLKILNLGKKLNIPIELTWSCANNGEVPCGECFGCIERRNNLE